MGYYDGPPQIIKDEDEPQVLLYRIEDKDGIGPWMGGLIHVYRAVLHREMMENPNLYPQTYSPDAKINTDKVIDIGNYVPASYIFGCRTLDDLRIQCPSPAECRAMSEAGGVLAVYKVSAYQTVGHVIEVAFNRDRAVLLETRPLTDLHATAGTIPLVG
ncbi:hypothetical protein FJ951_06265 [Mesorhizobium sp. B2-2-3]|uniref:hypothetical protein n=1 Tax=Mesorhizobium sp. B2-2-3 TaxID=2589963 RepID=UPI001127F51E|nr:hypothetical protein [Mesorhizobium sp. B2-2-3]TPM51414.1 hypothetical protein FJ951_06265 [Mesorhizobium sp. B2-2-3]